MKCVLEQLLIRIVIIIIIITKNWTIRRMGRPVLNLNYLLDTIVQKIKPLDWDVFWEKQLTNKITLKVSLYRQMIGAYILLNAYHH